MNGISVVVPVHNGEAWIRGAVSAILAQADDRPLEVILVDDCSDDRSAAILAELSQQDRVNIDVAVDVVSGPGRGAAAAINAGVRAARYPLIAQIDQDVVVQPGWFSLLAAELDDPSVGAAQGYYLCAANAGVFARVMNLDLEQRYAGIDGSATDHVCTGNAMYRADALHRVGLFDESLGYGYDNDISYRLCDAAYRLRINRSARAVHCWREGLSGYLSQQYGFGYGRLDLVAKHPHRMRGDSVSPTFMMLHPAILLAAAGFGAIGMIATASHAPASIWWLLAALFAGALVVERTTAGLVALRRSGDAAALAFPVVHALRDAAWVAAMVMWSLRRVSRKPGRPSDSMTPRAAYPVSRGDSSPAPKRPKT